MSKLFRKVANVFKRELTYSFPRPQTATLGLTSRCNLKCRSCGVWRQPSRKDDELSLDTIRRVLRELKEFGVKTISLIEGEPLVRTDIVEILGEITELGMESEITTNGTLLQQEKAQQLVQAGLSRVMVSIDAPNETHDVLRGMKGTFDRAIRGLEQLVAARQEGCPTIFVSVLLSSENIPFLDQWLDFAEKVGIDGFNFTYPTFVSEDVINASQADGEEMSSGRFTQFDGSLVVDKNQMAEVLLKLKRIRQEGRLRGIEVWLGPDMYLCEPDGFETGVVPTRKCYLIRNSIIIDPYGNVMPCALMDKYYYGSVLEDSIEDIWLNIRHRALITRLDKGLEMCRYCRCHFGCNLTPSQQVKRKLKGV